MSPRPWWTAVGVWMMVSACGPAASERKGPDGLGEVPVAAADSYYIAPAAPAEPIVVASEVVARCEGGDGAACVDAGFLYAVGERVALNYPRATELYSKGCELGVVLGCHRQALLITDGRMGDPPDYVLARALYRRACDGDIAPACTNLGAMMMGGEGGAADVGASVALYAKACEGEDAFGCSNLARWLSTDAGGKVYGRALTLYERACALKMPSACGAAASFYDEGRGVAVDDVQARVLYERACELGFGPSCNDLGAMFESGEGGQRDEMRALKLYTEACEKDNPIGCRNLGRVLISGAAPQQQKLGAQALALACKQDEMVACMLLGQCMEEGKGVDRDMEMALQLYSYTCESGLAPGCFAAALFVDEAKDGKARDAERALGLYAKACDGDDKRGCFNAGWMLEKADGIPADVQRALTFYERACGDKFAKGCFGAAKLYRSRARPDDLGRARELLGGLCDENNAESCEELAQLLESGQGGAKDAKAAGRARAQACAMGYKASCDKL
jgi:uncharacterized protein